MLVLKFVVSIALIEGAFYIFSLFVGNNFFLAINISTLLAAMLVIGAYLLIDVLTL